VAHAQRSGEDLSGAHGIRCAHRTPLPESVSHSKWWMTLALTLSVGAFFVFVLRSVSHIFSAYRSY